MTDSKENFSWDLGSERVSVELFSSLETGEEKYKFSVGGEFEDDEDEMDKKDEDKKDDEKNQKREDDNNE